MTVDIFEKNDGMTTIHHVVTGKADFVFKDFLNKSDELISKIDESLSTGDKRRLERILNEYIDDLKTAMLDMSVENRCDILFDILPKQKIGKDVKSRSYPERPRKDKVWASHWVQFSPEEPR